MKGLNNKEGKEEPWKRGKEEMNIEDGKCKISHSVLRVFPTSSGVTAEFKVTAAKMKS